MDSYEWNKIAGWILAAAASVLGLSILTGYMFTPAPLERPAYVVEGVEVESAGPAAEAEQPIEAFLASADIARGENQFKKCAACHTINKGGGQGIGPNIYGILGATHAHISSFAYSDAMKATSGKVWDWTSLSEWLKNPRSYIPGNKMSFAGLSRPQDRADLLVYLNAQSDSPQPLPAAPAPVAAEAPADDAAPAEDAAPADAAEVTPEQAAEATPTA